MELDEIFSVLELTPGATVGELNSTYRRLAKKYHPDFNQGRESWAHLKMTRLNLAYEAALERFSSPPKAAGHGKRSPQPRRRTYGSDFMGAVDRVLTAVYTYYQYGLENVHLRREGVRRFRYRECLRGLDKGIQLLESLGPRALLESERDRLTAVTEFAKAFRQSALLDRFYTPTSDPRESRAYNLYRSGSESLDYAIKDVFFGDLLIPVRNGSYCRRIAAGYEDLLAVLAEHSTSGWVPEAVIKIYLLEMLTKVIGALEKLRH